jgi:hypothetical protein
MDWRTTKKESFMPCWTTGASQTHLFKSNEANLRILGNTTAEVECCPKTKNKYLAVQEQRDE